MRAAVLDPELRSQGAGLPVRLASSARLELGLVRATCWCRSRCCPAWLKGPAYVTGAECRTE
eukprot:8139076-Alexandrium_andersonii.AAC.1